MKIGNMKNINMELSRGTGLGMNGRYQSGNGPSHYCDDDMIKIKFETRMRTELLNIRVTMDEHPTKKVYKVFIDGDLVREMWDWTDKKASDPESYYLCMDLIG